MPKTKDGEQITWKEFMARWKKGIEGVSPLHQAKVQVRSTNISLIGIVGGMVMTAIHLKDYWWMFIILCGALGNVIVQRASLIQRRNLLIKLEEDAE